MHNFQNFFEETEISTEYGKFQVYHKKPDEFLSYWGLLERNFLELFNASTETIETLNSELNRTFQVNPNKVLFLDIETTSLSPNSPLFLIGLLYLKEGKFKIEQLFARDYSEELPLISYLNRLLRNFQVLLTFNGKSFDVSYIEIRSAYHKCPFLLRCFHIDLLLHARRRWKHSLPNCKLQTLETYICNRRRMDDIPSYLIPEAYHEFVRNGDFTILKEIFEHNALDLITMMELTTKLVLI